MMNKEETKTISEEEYLQHTQDDDGYCTSCGEFSMGGCEPDARGYECPSCGEHTLMGTEEALMEGSLDIS